MGEEFLEVGVFATTAGLRKSVAYNSLEARGVGRGTEARSHFLADEGISTDEMRLGGPKV
jgi:hypothetical protein